MTQRDSEQIEPGREGRKAKGHVDPLRAALDAQSRLWPEVRAETGGLESGWTTAEALFSSDDALGEYLAYEGSFHPGTDLKTCAAALLVDYCYIFSMATVPLFAGFGIVPVLSPSFFALRFYTAPLEHDGRTIEVRRAHIRFLSTAFSTDRESGEAPPEACRLTDGDGLCEIYRQGVEDHFDPLVSQLNSKTGLSKNALWRLVADAIAGRFLDAGRRFNCLEQAKALAMTILKRPGSPLFNRQLHYFDLTVHDDDRRELLSWTFRARGGCCRYYTVERGAFCSTCVLKPVDQRDAELLRAMRRRLGLPVEDAA